MTPDVETLPEPFFFSYTRRPELSRRWFLTNYFSFMAITSLFEGPWRKTVYHGFEQNYGFFPILNLRPLCHAFFRFWVQLEKTNFFTEKYIVIDVWKRLNGVYKIWRLTSKRYQRHFFLIYQAKELCRTWFLTNYFSFMVITPLFEGPWRKTVYHGFEQNSGFFPILNLRPLCHALYRFWVQL